MIPLLEVIGIVKRFPGTLALDRVDLAVKGGETHALLGQNGAGKSTLIKILAGIYAPTAGILRWRGEIVDPAAMHLPIIFIHQDLGLVESMTVAENIALLTGYPRKRGIIDWHGASAAAVAALRTMESSIDPEARVGTISAAERSIVAIARALAARSDLLILDEPIAALPADEVNLLLDKLKRLRESGIGILYVTHRLDEVFRIADCVTVLRDGRKVATRPVNETSPSDLVWWIVGGALAEATIANRATSAGPLLSLKHLVVPQESGAGMVGPVSFEIYPGETLALVGLRGAGHHAIGRAIFGALSVYSGRIIVEERELKITSPADAIKTGIGFVSSRRWEESLAHNLTVLENLYLNSQARGISPFRPVGHRSELGACQKALARFSVRPPNPTRPIATLSGGNQQKVVLARWMEADARLLILEEPTIGVDIGSKEEIYRDLRIVNFRSIVNNKSVQALLALAVFLPMTANHFDLSVGFLLGISQVLVIGLQGQSLNWLEASGVVLLLGAAVGLVNGVLVTIIGIDSFIATLGTGTLLYGFNEWYTGGQQVVAQLPDSFINISGAILGIPLPAIYVLVLTVSLWIVFEYLPVGRHLYVLGASPRAAELNGISARRYATGAFLVTGIISAFAGIVLQSQLQVGQSSVGQEYLLPAFTAALLGATSVRPGRVNVWGTILAVAVLAVTVAGLNQMGAPFFVEPIFNGAMLILAVGLAVTASKRSTKPGRPAQ